MLAAYLRGLLKPSMPFGVKSYLFEDVILEAMTAHIAVENFRLSIAADSAVASILTDDGKRGVLRRTQRQVKRHAALQLLDIYGLVGGRKEKQESSISLLQLFHLMQKEGIIHPDEAPTTTET